MNEPSGTAADLIELIKGKAPAYLDLLTAKTDEDFELAFDKLFDGAVSQMETYKGHFTKLDEEGLSGTLKMALSVPGLITTPETHSNGHVDLTITATQTYPERKKLIEAKIWKGPQYHIGGLEQLLTRYTTGREGRGIVISYVRTKDISGLFNKLRAVMDSDLPCRQTAPTTSHLSNWSFVSTHDHSCGDPLDVRHVGCNLFVESEPNS